MGSHFVSAMPAGYYGWLFPFGTADALPRWHPFAGKQCKTPLISFLEAIALLLTKKIAQVSFTDLLDAPHSKLSLRFLNTAYMQLNSVHVSLGERVAGSTPARAVTGNKRAFRH